MAGTLTAAGINLCLSLGILNPTLDACDSALMRSRPPSIDFGPSPSTVESLPNRLGKTIDDVLKEDGGWEGCINYETYETYNGTKTPNGDLVMEDNGTTEGGKGYFCWRTATIHWIPEAGRWVWTFDKK